MKNFVSFRRFARDEDGAVTVDWVVLTAALVGLGVLVVNTVASGVLDTSRGIDDELRNMTIATY